MKCNSKRACVIIDFRHDQWDVDLPDFQKLTKMNDDRESLLEVIGIFSHYNWVEASTNKTLKIIVRAFEKIFVQGGVPKQLCMDGSTELVANVHIHYVNNVNINTLCLPMEKARPAVQRD